MLLLGGRGFGVRAWGFRVQGLGFRSGFWVLVIWGLASPGVCSWSDAKLIFMRSTLLLLQWPGKLSNIGENMQGQDALSFKVLPVCM